MILVYKVSNNRQQKKFKKVGHLEALLECRDLGFRLDRDPFHVRGLAAVESSSCFGLIP